MCWNKSKTKSEKCEDKEVVTSNDVEKVKTANDALERKKTMVDDVTVGVDTGEPYVRCKSSSESAAVTIGGKHSTYKVSNNFCSTNHKQ